MKTPIHAIGNAGHRPRPGGFFRRTRRSKLGAVMVMASLAMVLGACGEQPAADGTDPSPVETTPVSPPALKATAPPSETAAISPPMASVDPELQSMEDGQFWDIIDRSLKAADGSIERQATELEDILAALPPEQVAAFQTAFVTKNLKLHTWELWGAAYVLNGGCSDDCFEYFRSWVVGQGSDYYKAVQRDPQVLDDGRLGYAFESDDAELLAYSGEDAYRRASGGRDLYLDYPQTPSTIAGGEPAGAAWDEDEVEKLYPGLTSLTLPDG
jgi:hypothetical protein